MTRELIERMTYEQMVRAYNAYTQLQCVYEDMCNGPYGARAHKEYFAICDSREYLRRKCLEIASKRESNGQ